MSVILSSFRARLQATERDLAVEALKVADGSINQAARLTGLHRYQLRRIVVRHNLQALLKRHSNAGQDLCGNEAWRALADA
jgi:transcriptional regulator with GAF, ATPase, and Fis domain